MTGMILSDLIPVVRVGNLHRKVKISNNVEKTVVVFAKVVQVTRSLDV
jgi:hypothetical protein